MKRPVTNYYFICLLALLTILMGCSPAGAPSSFTTSGVSRELAAFRQNTYRDVRYELAFYIPAVKQERVAGKVIIGLELASQQPLIIDFRAEPEQVSTVILNGENVAYEVANEHIVIDKQYTRPGNNEIAISFTPADQSLNRRDEFLYTLLVPERARTLFPCFDQPGMKALYTLTLEVPEEWEAVSNSAVTHIVALPELNRKQISFGQTEPLSTYLFSFVAGILTRETYDRNGRSISVYHRETDPRKVAQCPQIASEVFDALEWLEAYTTIPYPFAKYDVIILPGFQYGGMEHTGATLYTDRRMFLNESATLNERLSRSALIAHETAHMWFGDYVTMEWFDDVWTKEVFANYFAALMVEPLFPEVNHRLNFISSYVPKAYSEDRTAGSNPVRQPLDNLRNAGLVYGNIIYNKSPVVMEMLVQLMGEESFRKGIQEYLHTYAYGNATWDGLIRILDSYTTHDLATWSRIWINEKGMPAVTATVEGNELVVRQSDPFGRGLCWPQPLAFRVVDGDQSHEVTVTLTNQAEETRVSMPPVGIEAAIIPNTDGRGYGFFRLTEKDARLCMATLHTADDETLKGNLLIVLHENLLNHTIQPEWFMKEMLAYAANERNPLLFSAVLDYTDNCIRLFNPELALVEKALWQLVENSPEPTFRLQAFRLYRSVARSEEAVGRLYTIWNKQQPPTGCILSEEDYIRLGYQLAVHMPAGAEQILTTQQARISNPDRQAEFRFVSAAVSPHQQVRDSLFNALLLAENRRIEPWASAALSYLNHPVYGTEAVKYIRPALDILPEVQRTGDIFFPTNWLRALLSGHHTPEARREIDRFFIENPEFSPMLSNKICQQADFLYRMK